MNLIFQVLFGIYFLLKNHKKGLYMCGTPEGNMARRRHVAEPRKPMWTPTWPEETIGLSVCGPTGIVGPRYA